MLNNFQLTGNVGLKLRWLVVLYLLNLDKRIRRYVLAMIIVNDVVLHTATAVTAAGSNSKMSSLFLTPYAIIERIQITVFFVQESVLSGLYVWKACSFLAVYRSDGGKTQDKLRAMMMHLILSNVVEVSLDITCCRTRISGFILPSG